MKNRPLRVFLFFSAITVGGGCYFLLAHYFSISIPCFFYQLTGWQCPGCGITRMAIHLIQGEFRLAFQDNPVLFCLLPVFAGYLIAMTRRYLGGRSLTSHIMDIGLIIVIVILLIWGIVRNRIL